MYKEKVLIIHKGKAGPKVKKKSARKSNPKSILSKKPLKKMNNFFEYFFEQGK